MKIRFFLIFLLWSLPAMAKITTCESMTVSRVEKSVRKIAPAVELTLPEFLTELGPTDFADRLEDAKFWIDLGGQQALATTKAREVIPGLQTFNAVLPLQEYPRASLQNADVITDLGYSLNRTAYPDVILDRVNRWLAPNGVAILSVDEKSVVHVSYKQIPLMDWILDRSGMKCQKRDTDLIQCQKRPNKEIRPLKLIAFKNGIREFAENHDDDLEPNVVFQIQNDAGVDVGTFDARMSIDGEILSNMYFHINDDFKGQGYSREIAREIATRYPKVNELRGTLIVDNLAKYNEMRKAGLSDEAAIKETAFYRTFKPYGFLDIELPNAAGGEIIVVLRKGPDRFVSLRD